MTLFSEFSRCGPSFRIIVAIELGCILPHVDTCFTPDQWWLARSGGLHTPTLCVQMLQCSDIQGSIFSAHLIQFWVEQETWGCFLSGQLTTSAFIWFVCFHWFVFQLRSFFVSRDDQDTGRFKCIPEFVVLETAVARSTLNGGSSRLYFVWVFLPKHACAYA